MERAKILKALECCTFSGTSSCADCPIKDECKGNPFDSVITKHSSMLVKDLIEENRRLKAALAAAEDCIYTVEDHLCRGSGNDWASEAIEAWENSRGEYYDR